MSFKCQKEAYLQRYSSRVVACRAVEGDDVEGKYEVVLEDTVLFPEGGGQVGLQWKSFERFQMYLHLHSSLTTEGR